jgi:hypothetical protein
LESADKRKSPETRSEEALSQLDEDTLKAATVFECTYQDNSPPILWKIWGENEYIENDAKYKAIKERSFPHFEIDFENKELHENFFQHVWPDMTGWASRMDRYLSDPQAEWHQTYKNKQIKFHDRENDDPDWKVKQCILVMIAAATEMEQGMNCWNAGKGPGRKYYPGFGQWVPKDEFECFKSCAAWMWADEKWWFCDRQDVDWEAFMPTIDKWNFTRTKLCVCWLLMLDEAMSGWKPKTSKRGGLPNITFEPRKPVDLGTKFRNSAECHSGIFMHIDPVMCPEKQDGKTYADLPNHLPRGPNSHVVSRIFIFNGSGSTSRCWCQDLQVLCGEFSVSRDVIILTMTTPN